MSPFCCILFVFLKNEYLMDGFIVCLLLCFGMKHLQVEYRLIIHFINMTALGVSFLL